MLAEQCVARVYSPRILNSHDISGLSGRTGKQKRCAIWPKLAPKGREEVNELENADILLLD